MEEYWLSKKIFMNDLCSINNTNWSGFVLNIAEMLQSEQVIIMCTKYVLFIKYVM